MEPQSNTNIHRTDDRRAGGRRGRGRPGRVETDGLLLNDSLEMDKPFASQRRDACAPFMQCKMRDTTEHFSKAHKQSDLIF